jgi:dihydrofolate reductase
MPGRGPEAVAGDKFGLKEVLDTVVSRSLERATDWQNSTVLEGDVVAAVRERKQARDIMVTGSTRVVRTLMAHDLVDEYRLIVFPIVLGAGARLFPDGTAPIDLDLVSARTAGPAVRLIYTRRGVRLFDSTELDLRCVETIQGEEAVHLHYGVQ